MFDSTRVLLALLLTSIPVASQSKNLLFYGNSYTYYSWGYGVPELVGMIATEAGHPTPNIVTALAGGVELEYHATNPAQIAVIGSALPPGQTWDSVVMQGHALEATPEAGYDPANFRRNAVTITSNVRSHSPAARAILSQTWSNAQGHMWFPIPWAGPLQMHEVVRANYDLAVADIDTAFGPGTASRSAIGDGAALLEWDPAYYEADLSHPAPSMILMGAMCMYTSIYGERVCDITPDFGPTSTLTTALSPFGLDESDWAFFAGIADRCAKPEVRLYPGSGDHVLLESTTDSQPLTACPYNRTTLGTPVQIRMRSLNGVYDDATAWLITDVFATGSPPGPAALYPEVQYGLGSMAALLAVPDLNAPLTLAFPMPVTLPGFTVLVQGLIAQPSSETGNAVFTTTDAHEFEMF
ncbi:MAG: hypothetical protein AB8H80_20805 [Planctomycetota bacterium]